MTDIHKAMEKFSKVNQEIEEALKQTEKPPVKSYCGGKPNYCTPVDAVNMSQERVDETAKREHESDAPDIVVVDESVDGNNTISWMINLPLPVGTRLYTAPPISDYHEGWEEGFKAAKKEWVGLTDEEYDELMLSGDWGGSLIQATQAKLKEKNT